MRPRLKDRDVRTAEEYQTMSAGFQIAMTSNKHREENKMPDNTKVQIPVVGYTGHRMGYKSQNFYGKNYRDCAIQSKMVQRMAQWELRKGSETSSNLLKVIFTVQKLATYKKIIMT